MAAEIPAAREAGQHPLDLREHFAAVRIRAEEAEMLVQAKHLTRVREPRPGEPLQECELRGRAAGAVLEARRFEPSKQRGGRGRHGGAF